MSDLEQKKQLLKFNNVVIKNLNSKTHILLTNPEINKQIQKINNKINNLFKYTPKKPVEEMSNREFKKYKKSKKRNEMGVPKNIDFKKLLIAAICFFSIAIIGAIVSWIYLATIKIKPSEILNSQVEVFCYSQTDNSGVGEPTNVDLTNFSKTKISSADVKPYYNIKFTFKERFSPFEIKNMYFKLTTSGRGMLNFTINYYDCNAKTNEPVFSYSDDDFIFENKKTYSFKINSNYKFASANQNSYIELIINNVNLASNSDNYGIALHGLLFNKA